MPAVSHNGHSTNVHSGFVPGVAIATAINFTVAGQPILRVGDMVTPHPKPGTTVPPHVAATVSAGAPTFTVAGQAVARVDDPLSCGAKMAQGVANFVIG
jgi:uncharacterized Zn-binding protein involved in type VI secretion